MSRSNSTAKALLTAKEVAALLRMPMSTVYHLAKTRQIPAVQIGRTLRFKGEAINELLNAGRLKARVLIVDEDATTVRVLGTFLERAGHAVDSASSAADARELAAHRAFDLLLVDAVLPDGSGLELVEELSPYFAPEQVIVMTAHVDLAEVKAWLKRHPLTLVGKPLDPLQLVRQVTARIGKPDREIRGDASWKGTE